MLGKNYPELEKLSDQWIDINSSGGSVTLDGSFTAEELRLIADVIDNCSSDKKK